MLHEMMHDIDAVILDMDGSLVDSMWMWRAIDIEYLGRYGIALPEDLQIQTPREFQINYSREAVLGDTLRLEGFRGEEGYWVEGLGPRGSCFTALCVF